MRFRTVLAVASLILTTSCDPRTDPLLEDVRVARAAWAKNPPLNYTFVVADGTIAGKVRVVNGKVVEPANARTLDDYWRMILNANGRGALLEWKFSAEGIPLSWRIDDYVSESYDFGTVTNFQRQ